MDFSNLEKIASIISSLGLESRTTLDFHLGLGGEHSSIELRIESETGAEAGSKLIDCVKNWIVTVPLGIPAVSQEVEELASETLKTIVWAKPEIVQVAKDLSSKGSSITLAQLT